MIDDTGEETMLQHIEEALGLTGVTFDNFRRFCGREDGETKG